MRFWLLQGTNLLLGSKITSAKASRNTLLLQKTYKWYLIQGRSGQSIPNIGTAVRTTFAPCGNGRPLLRTLSYNCCMCAWAECLLADTGRYMRRLDSPFASPEMCSIESTAARRSSCCGAVSHKTLVDNRSTHNSLIVAQSGSIVVCKDICLVTLCVLFQRTKRLLFYSHRA